jgi:hypothetical protein
VRTLYGTKNQLLHTFASVPTTLNTVRVQLTGPWKNYIAGVCVECFTKVWIRNFPDFVATELAADCNPVET